MLSLTDFRAMTQKGDILPVANTAFDPIGSAIRWWTGGRWSHVLLVSGDDEVIDVTWCGVKKIAWEGSVYAKSYRLAILRPDASEEQKDAAVQFALSKVGKRYDYSYLFTNAILLVLNKFGLGRDFRNRFDVGKAYTCIELPVDAYFETSQLRIIEESINRSQAIPDDLFVYGQNLKLIGVFGG
jgi:uncharacterized protein YycO